MLTEASITSTVSVRCCTASQLSFKRIGRNTGPGTGVGVGGSVAVAVGVKVGVGVSEGGTGVTVGGTSGVLVAGTGVSVGTVGVGGTSRMMQGPQSDSMSPRLPTSRYQA